MGRGETGRRKRAFPAPKHEKRETYLLPKHTLFRSRTGKETQQQRLQRSAGSDVDSMPSAKQRVGVY